MKITFIKDHVSADSGNSFYKAGTQADLRGGRNLVDISVAIKGWEGQEMPELSMDQLRERAKGLGVRGYHRMKRKTLIERINDCYSN